MKPLPNCNSAISSRKLSRSKAIFLKQIAKSLEKNQLEMMAKFQRVILEGEVAVDISPLVLKRSVSTQQAEKENVATESGPSSDYCKAVQNSACWVWPCHRRKSSLVAAADSTPAAPTLVSPSSSSSDIPSDTAAAAEADGAIHSMDE